MLTMFLSKCQAMLLLLLVMIAGKSLAAPDYILSNPRMLQVRTDPSRAAIIISRTVKSGNTGAAPTTPAAGSPTTPASDAGNATTTTTETPSQDSKMTGLMQIAFAGLRELDNNNTEVSATYRRWFNSYTGCPGDTQWWDSIADSSRIILTIWYSLQVTVSVEICPKPKICWSWNFLKIRPLTRYIVKFGMPGGYIRPSTLF